VYLAGGPGAPSIPGLDRLATAFAPALATRDLIVFDQRGTGLSSPQGCPPPSGNVNDARDCAKALGARRAFFSARDFADDLDAVRVAVGVDRIAVSGVSYGGVTVYDYATRYPEHVEWLLFDSSIAPRGFDPLGRSAATAATELLGRLCAPARRCRGIARSPRADMTVLQRRARRAPLKASYLDARGRRRSASLTAGMLFGITRDSDRNPALRAQLPAALRAAAAGDVALLSQLGAALAGLDWKARGGSGQTSASELNHSVNVMAVCEDSPLPWTIESASDSQARIAALLDAAFGVPAATYGPFYRVGVVFAPGTPGRQCLTWPHSPRATILDAAPAPDIPVLVLAGDDDVRAPVPDARAIARRFRRSALVVAQDTGHGVLGSAPEGVAPCVRAGLERFLAGTIADSTCRAARRAIPAAPFVPATLARVPDERGLGGLAGRTLRAVRLTARATRYTASTVATVAGSLKVEFGGLRGGRVSVANPTYTLKAVVVVPGVVVSGTLKVSRSPAGALVERGSLRVSGRGAHGTVMLDGDRARGILGGHRFTVRGASLEPPA
jgi:pimeloyl-ACP methyl ester carboxylesterase